MDPIRLWKYMRPFNRRLARSYLCGFGPQKIVLLLTTAGRRTGQPRITPLQYEVEGRTLYLASARGAHADWYRNILANPCVQLQINPDCRFLNAPPGTAPGDDSPDHVPAGRPAVAVHPGRSGSLRCKEGTGGYSLWRKR